MPGFAGSSNRLARRATSSTHVFACEGISDLRQTYGAVDCDPEYIDPTRTSDLGSMHHRQHQDPDARREMAARTCKGS